MPQLRHKYESLQLLLTRVRGAPMPGHDAILSDEDSARRYVEAMRWPDGPTCTRCQTRNVIRMGGRTQSGMFLCRECRNKFTCRKGTAMEHSHVPLHKWLVALSLVTSCNGYLSPQKLKLRLGLGSYRTAWFMAQRIRDALWRHRQELERQGCGRDLISPVLPGLGRSHGESGRMLFDAALAALIACPPDSAKRARAEKRRHIREPRSNIVASP